jgi:hypothetical protein
MDLALSLVEGLDSEALGMLFTTTKPALQDNDGAVQKKAYKVLASICQGNIGFMSLKSEEILETLLTSLSSVHSSARRHRLICLHHLILHLSKVSALYSWAMCSFVGFIQSLESEAPSSRSQFCSPYKTNVAMFHYLV